VGVLRPPRRKRRLILAAVIPPGLVLLGLLAFQAAVAWLPYPTESDQPLTASTWIDDRDGNCLAVFASTSGQWCLPLTEDRISPHLFDAIVATEDSRFLDHHGVDWFGVAAAAEHDLIHLTQRRGASTITMQLFRLRQPAARSIPAKLAQAIHASQIEQQLTKRQILVEYLNRAPFGGNLIGAGAASWRYFGRPCSELSLGQAALLAGIPQNPNGLRPDRFPARARARRDHVLDRMLAAGLITETQRRQAASEPIDATWRPLPQDIAIDPAAPAGVCDADALTIGLLPTLTDMAWQYSGQTLHTTIDPTTQRRATLAAGAALTDLQPSHITAAAVVVLDTPSASVLAAVSLTTDSGKTATAVDLTSRPRSTGSTLKPFIYAAAFDAGICSPQSIINDAPTAWAAYEPSDYDRDFRGPMTAADALAQSRNVPALVILSKVGLGRAVDVMGAFGLKTLARTPEKYGLPLAIGGADATPLELAEAYATLARAGRHRDAALLAEPVARHDVIVAQPSTMPAQSPIDRLIHNVLLRPATCRQTLYCLADENRTARVWPGAAGLAPAWKTGTSSGHRDAWCAAVTPRRTVVVWLGNADGSGSSTLVGQDTAAPLALQILAATDGGGDGFAPPDGFALTPSPASNELTASTNDRLAILSPSAGQEIVHDPSIPDDRQRLSLRARAGEATSPIFWFIDNVSIGRSDGQPLWWTPTPGMHTARATTPDGHSAQAEFRVR